MNRTKIEWAKNPDGTPGYTWNPITGCLNGCEYCYARKLANGRLRSRYLSNDCVATKLKLLPPAESLKSAIDVRQALEDPFYPRFWEDRLDDFDDFLALDDYLYDYKVRRFKAKGIFTCDMSDLFGIGVPEEWTRKVLRLIEQVEIHRFYLLTKQPQNLIKFSPFPDNCWVGVTATNQIMWNEALRYLTDIKATVKYMSIEPYLERIVPEYTLMLKSGIKQVIIGAQTKPRKLPDIQWIAEILRACDQTKVPVFLKHNLNSENLPSSAFDERGLVRQELPSV